MGVRALVLHLCFSLVMTWAEIPPLSSLLDFFLLMSQNPGLLARLKTVGFLCVTLLREELTKEIIDPASKREREDPESHRGPEKTATKYRKKAGYSEKKPRQTELQRSSQSGDGQWRSWGSSWKDNGSSTLGTDPKLSQTSHPITDLGEVGSSLMNGLVVQRMPSIRLCNLEGSCLVFYYWRLSYLESLRPENNGRQVAWMEWAIGPNKRQLRDTQR